MLYLAIQARYSIQKQPGFFDLQFRLEDLSKIGDPLIEQDKVIEWEKFAAILQAARVKDCMSRGVVGQVSRKPFPLLLMFKVLVLQGLSPPLPQVKMSDFNS